jgi:hypothetical protein
MGKRCHRDLSKRDPISLSARTRNLSGLSFGRLIVVCPVERRKNAHILYLCACECGAELFVTCSNLKSGHTTSCGCADLEERVAEIAGTKITF